MESFSFRSCFFINPPLPQNIKPENHLPGFGCSYSAERQPKRGKSAAPRGKLPLRSRSEPCVSIGRDFVTSRRPVRKTDVMKKWLKRLIISVVLLVFLFLTVSLVVRQIAVHRAERDFPPPGRLIEIDGRLSHIHCIGRGSPTILPESGLDDRGSWSWSVIQD